MYVVYFYDKEDRLLFSIEAETEFIVNADQDDEFGAVQLLVGDNLLSVRVAQTMLGKGTYQRVQVEQIKYTE